MTTTTTSRSHHATTRATRSSRATSGISGTSSHSTAFVAEVRLQWALATSQYDDAVARADDGGRQEAAERLDELRELLSRHDLSPDVLRLGART